ncbi:MAG: hypothetical protein LBD33_02605 [Puniceicoccales bacterium]|jgi:hypothetical protein|nr:hypothetical protein [Puniceicoccales bacterium]
MTSGGLLEKFQTSLEKYLRGLNEFRGVHILAHKQSDIDSALRSVAESGIGVAIVVLPPHPTGVIPYASGPAFKKIVCKIQVIENLATNRTGRSAISVAEKVMQYLHLWRPRIADWNDELVLSSDDPWQTALGNNANIITLQFVIHCSLELV